MVRHNNVLPNVHLRKHWQRIGVRTWFNQPGRKRRRLLNRRQKATKLYPRPTSKLRPVVRACTVKYNTRERAGRGFTLTELKAAGLSRQFARSVGIAVDHRRKNRNTDALQQNVQRLRQYMESLVLFPRKAGKPKCGEIDDTVTEENLDNLVGAQVTGCKTVLDIVQVSSKVDSQQPSVESKQLKAYQQMRTERMNKRHHGQRLVRSQEDKKDDGKGKKGKGKGKKKGKK